MLASFSACDFIIVTSLSAVERIFCAISAPFALNSLASRSRSVCILPKIAWLFASGKSARLILTSTISIPKFFTSASANEVICFISFERSSDNTADRGSSPRTPLILELTTAEILDLATFSLPNAL